MGSLALLAKQSGHQVSGSDQNVYPPMSTQLSRAGIQLMSGYEPEHLKPEPDLVIIGNANLPRGNPAVEYVLDRGLDYVSGAEWLARYILKDRWVIAVAGTHGKTTTASMVAWILEYAGLEPGFLIGGVPANFLESARLGRQPFFVVEADEYDTSYFDHRSKFLHYRPRTTVLNNLEYDHADIFPDLAAIQEQFHLLIRSIPGNGKIIRPQQDAALDEVFARGCWTPVEYIASNSIDQGWHARPMTLDCSRFEVFIEGECRGVVEWNLLGKHNMNNGLAALAATRHAGVKPEIAIEALCGFMGVKRRMEFLFESGQTRVYEDFAHHPTAIETTLEGLRASVGDDEIIAVIEPASHTMKKGVHRDSLATACDRASRVMWFKPDSLAWDLEDLVQVDSNRFSMHTSTDEIVDLLATKMHDPERQQHVLIMSNGSFDGIYDKLRSKFDL
jgi:UDP-N-acetylmuramate: L-alanyl-gamma-D-glutamyl-meso-diaminopimelate ligase